MHVQQPQIGCWGRHADGWFDPYQLLTFGLSAVCCCLFNWSTLVLAGCSSWDEGAPLPAGMWLGGHAGGDLQRGLQIQGRADGPRQGRWLWPEQLRQSFRGTWDKHSRLEAWQPWEVASLQGQINTSCRELLSSPLSICFHY